VSEGTYANQTAYEEYVSVPANGCYFFTIGDSYGDGLYGEQWGSTNGFCNVASVNADLTYSSWLYAYDGDYNFEQENAAADVNTVVNVEGLQAETSFAVYPNPVSDVAFLELNMGQAANVNMTVLNLLGQTVMTENLGNVAAGQRRVELNFTNLQSGVYLVSLDMGASTQTLRVTVK